MAHTHTVIHKDRSDIADREVADSEHTTNVAARIINIIGSVIMGVLALRFVLMLLGANQGNAIVDFIYRVSQPFAAPFFGIFGYQAQYGAVRFEFETLIAIVFYAFLTWLLVRVVTINNDHAEV